jgi:hypothetical protein
MDAQMIHYAGQSSDMAKLRGQIEADIKKLEEEIR